MKKQIIITATILLIGIVSAGILAQISNPISATINVKGPVFYLNSDGSLLLNQEPTSEESFLVIPEEETTFFSDRLDINEMYKTTFRIHLWPRTTSGDETLQIKIIGEDGVVICETEMVVTDTSSHIHKEAVCTSDDVIDLIGRDKIGILLMSANENEGTIDLIAGHEYSGEYNRIEVTRA